MTNCYLNKMPIVLNYKILEKFLPKHVKKVAVAVSGGADSLSLTYIANKWCEKNAIDLHALIVDHKLRADSTDEAELVGRFLSSKNIFNKILTWEGAKPKSNIHQHARQMRYKLLIDYCKLHGIEHLLVAHTLSDQAETVLLRIFRGSGIDGISGIPSVCEMDGVKVVRPLLEHSRQDVEYTLSKIEWKWINDPSNENEKFERSKIRKFINDFAEKEMLIQRLSLLANNAKRARNFLEKHTEHIISSYVKFSSLSYALINREIIKDLDEEIVLRVLNVLLKRVGGKVYSPRLESLLKLQEQLQSKDFKAHTLQGVQLRLYKDEILFYREPSLVEEAKLIKKDTEACWDNRFVVSASIDGFIGALGKKGYVSIKKHLELDKQPNVEVLYSLPAIYDKKGKIMAVPHLQYFSKGIKVDISAVSNQVAPLFS